MKTIAKFLLIAMLTISPNTALAKWVSETETGAEENGMHFAHQYLFYDADQPWQFLVRYFYSSRKTK